MLKKIIRRYWPLVVVFIVYGAWQFYRDRPPHFISTYTPDPEWSEVQKQDAENFHDDVVTQLRAMPGFGRYITFIHWNSLVTVVVGANYFDIGKLSPEELARFRAGMIAQLYPAVHKHTDPSLRNLDIYRPHSVTRVHFYFGPDTWR